jgi:membrane dipeptidase|tara:strand:- start:23 stop:1105 length:1083 start_codon:yes stop_codon:yes gene_type:complete
MTSNNSLTDQAEQLHRRSLVVDTHIDTITHLMARHPDFGARLEVGHVDIPRLREGGVGAALFAIWLDDDVYDEPGSLKYVLQGIDVMRRTVDAHADTLEIAYTGNDVERIHGEGRIAVLLTIEGGNAICSDLGVLRELHRAGIRSITLTWQYATPWCDSCNDEPHGGLTDLGRDIVKEMGQIGMLPDVSHISDRAFYDVLESAEAPVFASHSSCRSLQDAKRNMTDDMIVALGQADGVININFASPFIGGPDHPPFVPMLKPERSQFRDHFERIHQPDGKPGAPMSRLLDHFDLAVKLAGRDNVGIGSDYDGVSSVPIGMDDISRLPNLTRGLLERGHDEKTVTKILGGNNLRLFKQVLR